MIRSKQDSRPANNPTRPIEDAISAPVAPISKPAVSSAVPDPVAVIGPKIRVKGELVGEEDLLIQGTVDGTIELKGNNLTIGKHGVVHANVLAKTITIEGTVEGDVFGEERIAIKSSSDVKGNLVADRVTLEDGAKFKGSIDMEVDARKDDFNRFNSNSMLNGQSTNQKSADLSVADSADIA